MRDPYWRRCDVRRVIDGDTLVLYIDQGFKHYEEHALRLLRVDAPELFSGTHEGRALGMQAGEWVRRWVGRHRYHDQAPPPWPFNVRTVPDKQSFGRYLGELECAGCGELLNDSIPTEWTP